MLARRQMAHEENILRPGKIIRVLRAGQQEAFVRQPACRLDKQYLECLLAISGKCTEIGEIGAIARGRGSRLVNFRVDMAVKRNNAARAQARAELLDGLAPRIAENEIKIAQTGRAQVRQGLRGRAAQASPGYRDRRTL